MGRQKVFRRKSSLGLMEVESLFMDMIERLDTARMDYRLGFDNGSKNNLIALQGLCHETQITIDQFKPIIKEKAEFHKGLKEDFA